METNERKTCLPPKLIAMMHDPIQLRMLITGFILAAAFVGLYLPVSQAIAETSSELAQEQKRVKLARDIEHLRAQMERFEKRLPKDTDVNEWVQYILEGIRDYPLKLVKLESRDVRTVGQYQAVVLNIELEGVFPDMDRFLRWVESNERLFRMDEVRIVPLRSNKERQVLELVVLGVMG